jgi:S1-C subfamily serine protease
MQKRASIAFAFFSLALGLQAQDAAQLYTNVAALTVCLKHEVFMDPALCKNLELVKKWETSKKSSILSTYRTILSGSGFFVGEGGLILTNRHVAQIDDLAEKRSNVANDFTRDLASSASKTFSADELRLIKLDIYAMVTKGSYRFSATYGGKILSVVQTIAVAQKDEPDIALLRADGGAPTGLKLASAASIAPGLVGTEVFSFGFPLGSNLEDMFTDIVVTMNKGTVSALRKADLGIQHSAAISHGNSGGPLVDISGTVLGMNTATVESGNSIFLAVGADKIRFFLAKKGVAIAEPGSRQAAAPSAIDSNPILAPVRRYREPR